MIVNNMDYGFAEDVDLMELSPLKQKKWIGEWRILIPMTESVVLGYTSLKYVADRPMTLWDLPGDLCEGCTSS